MDPIRELCKIKDNSFKDLQKITKNIPLYSENKIGSPRARRKALYGKNKNITFNINPVEVQDLEMDTFFKEKSVYILADIDTVFNFTLQEDGYLTPQRIDQDYKYAVLDENKGFLQYLQYRLPASFGFINCVELDKYTSPQFLNMNCDNKLTEYILNIVPLGVNLVVTNSFDKNKLIQGLKVCKEKGTFISRIKNGTPIEYLYAVTMAFSKFYLFKPFLDDKYSYFIAEDFSGNGIDIEKLDFDKIDVPDSFINYVKNYYNSLNNLKIDGKYNMYKCKALMNMI